jgi:hypothetical protein
MFYENLWLEEQKIAVKMPITNSDYSDKHFNLNVKLENFNLTKYTYLLSLD